MTTSAPSRPRRPAAPAAQRRAPGDRRRPTKRRRPRLWLLVAALVAVVAGGLVLLLPVDKAVKEMTLPLRHEDIIRQQAAEKGLDPALLAAVIYQESRFRDGQVSDAGAQGLMQLMPDTASYIARLSGAETFHMGDLATAQVNISYGAFYLRYLKRKYRGSDALALAAYNAGEGKLDEWLASAAGRGETFDPASHIPFPETREYVKHVRQFRDEYARQYATELGG